MIGFPPTRKAALARAAAFAPAMGRRYTDTRNYDFGPADRSNVSALSPHVRHRLITEEELARTALSAHSFDAGEKFLQEVFWRTYWKGWLELRPSVWAQYQVARDDWFTVLGKDRAVRAAYDEAIAGNTSIDCFDAWAQELAEHGYLHNHARMWFASIWIFTLGLPWELGADFFLTHLMDGDAASNTLSWRWVAGLQTSGKTYLARPSNIEKFTKGRFAPEAASLAVQAPAVAGLENPPAGDMPISAALPGGDYALLLHEDDCAFETLALPRAPAKVYVQAAPTQRGRQPLSQAAAAFTQGALDDTAARAAAHFACPVERSSPEALARDLPLYASYAPTGPFRDMAEKHRAAIHWIIRPIDGFLWPFATKGFFKFKSAIPKALDALGLR